MKYIKNYENLKKRKEPQIGDYVLLKFGDSLKKRKNVTHLLFMENHVGQITDTKKPNLYKIDFYTDIEGFIDNYDSGQSFWWAIRETIVEYSEDKEDLEIILAKKKYNI